MATAELICKDFACQWHSFSNEMLNKCPKCGGPIRQFLDEDFHDYYEEAG